MRRPLLALALAAATTSARPDDAPGLQVNVPVTAGVTAGALGALGISELLKDDLAPASCRWCEPPALDRLARARWSDPSAAGALSNVLVVALPASLSAVDWLSAGRDTRRAAEDVLVAAEATAIAGLGAQVAKFASARRRPDAWARGTRTSADDDLSFFSGHASVAFAAAGAFGTIAKLRGYSGWPAVYAGGFTAATGIAYLRMAADDHWLTDVAAGAALGAAVGIAVPLLLHRGHADEKGATATLTPFSLGAPGLAISGTF